jgi:hypothetical protein
MMKIPIGDLIVDSFVPGEKMMICPHQTWFNDLRKCKYQFPAGDGAFLICTYEHCLELKRCKLDVDEENNNKE